ncbi:MULTISPECIES: hypothetical protein [Pseudomonas syringae group]|nr:MULTISPECIES: hypothetical protein [Pseudomonas syringae group]
MATPVSPMLMRARNKLLVHPSQAVEFDYHQWQSDFEKYTDGSIADRSFCQGAGWLAQHFSRVFATRAYYKLDSAEALSKKELLQMHVAFANLSFVRLADERRNAITSNSTATLEGILAHKTSLVEGNVKLYPNQISMFNLDAVAGPIVELLHGKRSLDEILYSQSENSEKLDRFGFFMAETRAAQLHHNGVINWQQLLFGDTAFAVDAKKGRIIISQLNEAYQMRVISDYRREHHQITTVYDIAQAADMPFLKSSLANPKYILAQDANFALRVLDVAKCDDELLQFMRYKKTESYLGVEPHLFELLKKKIKAKGGRDPYSVRDILAIWFQLAALAFQLHKQSSTQEPANWDELMIHCHWHSRSALVEQLVLTTDLSADVVGQILELLTFRGRDRQDDLWAKPIIELDGDVAFAISPLLTTNMRRNVDIWLQAVDPKSNLRGTHFEEWLDVVMRECQVHNSIIGDQLQSTKSVLLKYVKGEESEEIDLTFNFGNTIVVVEARSRRTPITPLDYHNAIHEEPGGVLAKAAQAERKAAYVRNNLSAFCAQYYPHLSSGLDKVVVHPLVLVNDQFHAGFPVGKTPVLDEHLLKHFLKDGRARFMGSHRDRTDHKYAIIYYENLAEAETVFLDYALNPTIVAMHKLSIKTNSDIFDVLGAGEPSVQWLSYEVQEVDEKHHLEMLNKLSPGKLLINY